MLITTSSALAEFCHALRDVPYIAVDTEFMREKSYYAHLCLVQVAHGEAYRSAEGAGGGEAR